MFRTNRIPILLAVSAALTASVASAQRAGPNRSLYSHNQPVVERTDYVLDLPAHGGGLSAAERARLDDWFRSLGVGYGDRVFVDGASAAGAGRDDVARVAADYGLLLSEGAPLTEGATQPDSVRVILSRSRATVPGCPNWEGRSGPSSTSPNYGCAVNSNLAAMIADPNDLVLGQAGSASGDAATAAKAIKVYRETAPTGTKGLQDGTTTRRRN
jgi:pilus assembly protein CpaD